MDKNLKAFQRLLDIMDDLREKCPWDRKQTMKTLRNLTIEETYELVDAILDEDLVGVKEEIGDLMLHMVFYAKIGQEKNAFDIGDALEAVCDKLVERHPHIYGDVKVKDEEEVKQNWEQIKLRKGKKKSVLSGVPHSLPAMVKAYRMQEKTKQVGFEWAEKEDVWLKLLEEIDELKEVLNDPSVSQARREDEFGDVLFSLINFGRYYNLDAETSLAQVNQKFYQRFQYIESNASKPLKEMSLEEMDQLWDQAKRKENQT
ncbi:MAG: nucleoside triphosphate pyrophosphohydrolase [Saprospiraceae bacterium]|nr:nucleoside triphosphate pyrophosphohydrolase [Saprospiraceae bacterium]